jgi:PPOX class probable F420-dependent enzyme
MALELTAAQKSLIDGKNFAHVATIFPSGAVQVNPVWVDRDGDRVVINSAEGRAKVTNLRSDPRITLEISNAENPYEYLELRGRVVEMTSDGAEQHIDALAKKYMDLDEYPLRKEGEVRVKIVVEVEKVTGRA